MLVGNVPVYSVDDQIVMKVDRRKAITMMHRGVAVAREVIEDVMIGPYPLPSSLALIREVDWIVYQRTGTIPYSRNALFVRDRGMCLYCGKPGDTMDHIYPKSRGGRAEWTNAATACFSCNNRKADRTPDEAGMPLLRVPFAPTYLDIHEPRQ